MDERLCQVCDNPIPSRRPASYRVCGHPRCTIEMRRRDSINQYHKRKVREDNARRAPRNHALADTKLRTKVIQAMESEVSAGSPYSMAVKVVSVRTGEPPAVVMSIWKSVTKR